MLKAAGSGFPLDPVLLLHYAALPRVCSWLPLAPPSTHFHIPEAELEQPEAAPELCEAGPQLFLIGSYSW